MNRFFMQCSNLPSFTLAEVLITLGIIGIVATMVIPTLNEQIQDIQLKTAAKEAFSKSAQAVEQMRQDQGGTLREYVINSFAFKPAFMKYFKVAQDCPSLCVPSSTSSTIYSALSKGHADTRLFDDGQFVTTDGMFFGIENFAVTGYLMITVDVNGYTKKPNVYGKDVFMFEIVNDNLVAMGGTNTYLPTDSGSLATTPASNLCNPAVGNNYQGLGCMANVMLGVNY